MVNARMIDKLTSDELFMSLINFFDISSTVTCRCVSTKISKDAVTRLEIGENDLDKISHLFNKIYGRFVDERASQDHRARSEMKRRNQKRREEHEEKDLPTSFGAFLMRVRGMYLLTKAKNEDRVSCQADSHVA